MDGYHTKWLESNKKNIPPNNLYKSYYYRHIDYEAVQLSSKDDALEEYYLPNPGWYRRKSITGIIGDADIEEILSKIKLLPRQKIIMKKLFIDNCSQTEVAMDFGVSPSSINQSKKRIIEKLKKYFTSK